MKKTFTKEALSIGLVLVVGVCAILFFMRPLYGLREPASEVESYVAEYEISHMEITKNGCYLAARNEDDAFTMSITGEQFGQYIEGEIIKVEVHDMKKNDQHFKKYVIIGVDNSQPLCYNKYNNKKEERRLVNMGCIYVGVDKKARVHGRLKIGMTESARPTQRFNANKITGLLWVSCAEASKADLLYLESVARITGERIGLTVLGNDWLGYTITPKIKQTHAENDYASAIADAVIQACYDRHIKIEKVHSLIK